jgi:hypothetical protein
MEKLHDETGQGCLRERVQQQIEADRAAQASVASRPCGLRPRFAKG